MPACKVNLSEEERLIYDLLGDKPVHVDEIIEKSGLSSARVMSLLLKLEMRG